MYTSLFCSGEEAVYGVTASSVEGSFYVGRDFCPALSAVRGEPSLSLGRFSAARFPGPHAVLVGACPGSTKQTHFLVWIWTGAANELIQSSVILPE